MSSESQNKPVQALESAVAPLVSQQQVSKQCDGWFTKWFGCNKTTDALSSQITKEGVVAFGDQCYCPKIQGEGVTFQNLFNKQKRCQIKKLWADIASKWSKIDQQLSASITKCKQDNVLSIGDLRVRSVLMALSAAIFYRAISFNTSGFLRRSRNMGISFVLMGYWFVPQLFNPFLKKSTPKVNTVV